MNNNHLIAIALLVALSFAGIKLFNRFKESAHMQTGTIVILNGPSSAGKSSIQKEFQKIMYQPYLALGLDSLFAHPMPQQYMGGTPTELNMPGEQVIRGEFATDAQGNKVFNLSFPGESRKMIAGMHHAIAAYAQQGNSIIVDYILYDPAWLNELVKVLKDYKVYFIGIDIPLEVLEERERTRATSPVGHARSHYDIVHKHGIYDLRLDTSKLTAQEAAQQIKDFLQANPEPQAFKKLGQLTH